MKPRAKDEADLASEQEEAARQEALWRAQSRSRVRRTGTCYNCGEPTKDLYCDAACETDHQRRRNAQERNRA